MRKILLTLLLILFCTNAHAMQRKPIAQVNTNALVNETQISAADESDTLALVWWIPIEYWDASMASDGTDEQEAQVLASLEPYFLVGIVQADISPMGAFNFYSEASVLNGLSVSYTDAAGKQVNLSPIKEMDPNLDMLLKILKPILSQAMGQLGNSFHFYVYSDRTGQSKRLVDPYEKGSLLVTLTADNGSKIDNLMDLPLNSLYVPRKCPNGKDAHVSWNFCPWSGKKLKK